LPELACPMPHAAPDAADAVHHDMSLDAPAISWSGLLFFCEAQVKRRDLEAKSHTSGNRWYYTRCG